MLESAWLFIGAVAILTTAGSIAALDIYSKDTLALVLGVAGVGAWLMLAYGSLDVRVVGDSVTYSFTMPAVTLFCGAMALVPAFIALTAPVELVARARDTVPKDL